MTFFDELNQNRHELSPSDETDFFSALRALQARREPAPSADRFTGIPTSELVSMVPQEPQPTPQPQAPQSSATSRFAKGAAQALPEMAAGTLEAAGTEIDSRTGAWLERIARISPLAKEVIFGTGLGDDTVASRTENRLEAVTSGQGMQNPDQESGSPEETSFLFKMGTGLSDASMSALGITPEMLNTAAYKAGAAVGQAGANFLLAIAGTAATGSPAAGMGISAFASMGAEYAQAYQKARQMGASVQEARGHAERYGAVAGTIEYISLIPAAAAVQKILGQGAKSAGITAMASPTQEAFVNALAKRGLTSIRNPVVRRVGAAASMGVTEGAEEIASNIYQEADLKMFGDRWAPRKSWAEVVFNPENPESFLYGFIGGSTVGAVAGGGFRLSEERKTAAKEHFKRAAQNRGLNVNDTVSDEGANRAFVSADQRLNGMWKMTREELLQELSLTRSRAESAKSVLSEVEEAMVMDGIAEMIPSAKSSRQKKVSLTTAKDAISNQPKTQEDPSKASASKLFKTVEAAKSLLRITKRHGTESVSGILAAAQKLAGAEGVSATQKENLSAIVAVVTAAEGAGSAVDQANQQEMMEQQAQQEQQQLRAQVTTQELQSGAIQVVEQLRAARANPQKLLETVQSLLSHPGMVPLSTGEEVPAVAITSAALDMEVEPGLTVRALMEQAFEQDTQRQYEELSQRAQEAEAQQKIVFENEEKEAIKARADEHKQLLDLLKLDDQVAQIQERRRQMEEKARLTQEKESAAKEEHALNVADKKQSRAEKAQAKKQQRIDQAKAKKQAQRDKKAKVQKKPAAKSVLVKKIDVAPRPPEMTVKKKPEPKPAPKPKATPAPAAVAKKASKKPPVASPKPTPAPAPKPAPASAKPPVPAPAPTPPKVAVASKKEARSRKEGKTDPNTVPVHVEGWFLIKLGDNKEYKARVIGQPYKGPGGETFVRWERQTSAGKIETQKPIRLIQLNKLYTRSRVGKAAVRGTEVAKAFGISAAPMGTITSPAAITAPPGPDVATAPDGNFDPVLGKWMPWWQRIRAQFLYTYGGAIRKHLDGLGELIYRNGVEGERLSAEAQSQAEKDHSEFEEWSRKMFRGASNTSGRISGPYKKWFKALLSAFDTDARRAEAIARGGDWGAENASFIDAMEKELGFNPKKTLFHDVTKDEAEKIRVFAEGKVGTSRNETEKRYWARYEENLARALRLFDTAKHLTILRHVEDVPRKELRFLLAPLTSMRWHDDRMYGIYATQAINPNLVAGLVQNHVFEGLGNDFRERLHRNDDIAVAQVKFLIDDMRAQINSGSNAGDKLLIELQLTRSSSPDEMNKRLLDAAVAVLIGHPPTHYQIVGGTASSAFSYSRMGNLGPIVVDWTYDSLSTYFDQRGREIAEQMLFREFYETRDATGSPVYHNEAVLNLLTADKSIADARNDVLTQAQKINPFVAQRMLDGYLNLMRGRDVSSDRFREIASWLAKYQYATKLGNPVTLVRNAAILGSTALMMGPSNVWHAISAAIPGFYKDVKAPTGIGVATGENKSYDRAREAGVAPKHGSLFLDDAEKPIGIRDTKFNRRVSAIAKVMMYGFSKEEVFLRVTVANASLVRFHQAVRALQDPTVQAEYSVFDIFKTSKKEAKDILKNMFSLSDDEISEVSTRYADPTYAAELRELENKVMHHGSNLINYRSGGNFLPQVLAGNSAASVVFRTFNSFAYNIIRTQANLIWKPAIEGARTGDTEKLRVSLKRILQTYGGASVTALAVNAIIGALKDEDDKKDLRGDTAVTRWLWNRYADFATVGLLGRFERPLDYINPAALSGVNARTAQNIQKFTFAGPLRGLEDVSSGRFLEAGEDFAGAFWQLVSSELTVLRAARDVYRKYGLDEKDYVQARKAGTEFKRVRGSLFDKVAKEMETLAPSKYSRERDAVRKKLQEGDYFGAQESARDYINSVMSLDEVDFDSAVQKGRASVMIYAPLSDWSKTSDPKKAGEELSAFVSEMSKSRGGSEASKMVAAHMAYIAGVNAIFPRK